jgi:hypothetical protein
VSETRILRGRQQAASQALDASNCPDLYGSGAIVGQTTTVSSYPSAASSFFAVNPLQINGSETEGSPASYVVDTTTLFYAYNLGTQVPPASTYIVAHAVGGRWVFRYDG